MREEWECGNVQGKESGKRDECVTKEERNERRGNESMEIFMRRNKEREKGHECLAKEERNEGRMGRERKDE